MLAREVFRFVSCCVNIFAAVADSCSRCVEVKGAYLTSYPPVNACGTFVNLGISLRLVDSWHLTGAWSVSDPFRPSIPKPRWLLQVFLLLIAFLAVPWMLIPKPYILKKRHEARMAQVLL